MKICIVTQQFKNIYSGVGLHANILANYLHKNGHSITLVVPENQKPSSYQQFSIKAVKTKEIFNNQARWFSLSFSFSKAIKELEKSMSFDIIHFTDARESFLCKSKSALIGNINDTYSADLGSIGYYRKYYQDWLPRWGYYYLVHNLEKRCLSKMDYVIANSQFTYKTIRARYPQNIKLAICYKSVDKNRYSNVLNEKLSKKQSSKKPIILFVGGNMQRKGVHTLIEAAPEVVQHYPDVEFIIVGKDKAIKRLKEKCEKLKLSASFSFPGWCSQDEILNLHRKATLFVMPSLTEALGVAILEAMASGIPVIGTNVGGIPEIVRNGENGTLVPVNSPKDLSSAIIQLLANDQIQEKYRFAALETVEKFSIETMMNCTLNIYQEALNNKPSS